MKDSSGRMTRLSVITGTVVAVVALGIVLVTLFIAAPGALEDVETFAGQEEQTSSQETKCDYPREWIGEAVDEAAVKAHAKSYRILPPGAMATMDYRADRLNVETDEDGIVVRVTCG